MAIKSRARQNSFLDFRLLPPSGEKAEQTRGDFGGAERV